MTFVRSIKNSILIFLLLSILIPCLEAESGIYDRIGIINEHGRHGAVPEENIDLFTGNLTLKNLDIHLPGPNGFDLDIWRVYNSKILKDRLLGSAWGIQQEPYSWVGFGWSMHMGRLHAINTETPVIEYPDGRWETAYHISPAISPSWTRPVGNCISKTERSGRSAPWPMFNMASWSSSRCAWSPR